MSKERKERRMNSTKLLTRLLFLSSVVLWATITCRATVVTFDDLSAPSNGVSIASGYQGLSWPNFAVLNASQLASAGDTDGFYYGMVSSPNVPYNLGGDPAYIYSFRSNFN